MLVLAQEGSRVIIVLHGKEQALCPGGFLFKEMEMFQKSQKPHYHVPGKGGVESQNQQGGAERHIKSQPQIVDRHDLVQVTV